MYKISANRCIAVLLCALLVASSLSTVYAVEYNQKSGICYILPVYRNIYRISEASKQSLENEHSASDKLWIKEDASISLQDKMPDGLMPSAIVHRYIAKYTSALHFDPTSCSRSHRKFYHLLN